MEIIDSIGLVDLNVSSKLPLRPSRVTVSVSSSPSSRLAAAPGCLTSSCLTSARSLPLARLAAGSLQALFSLRLTNVRSA